MKQQNESKQVLSLEIPFNSSLKDRIHVFYMLNNIRNIILENNYNRFPIVFLKFISNELKSISHISNLSKRHNSLLQFLLSADQGKNIIDSNIPLVQKVDNLEDNLIHQDETSRLIGKFNLEESREFNNISKNNKDISIGNCEYLLSLKEIVCDYLLCKMDNDEDIKRVCANFDNIRKDDKKLLSRNKYDFESEIEDILDSSVETYSYNLNELIDELNKKYIEDVDRYLEELKNIIIEDLKKIINTTQEKIFAKSSNIIKNLFVKIKESFYNSKQQLIFKIKKYFKPKIIKDGISVEEKRGDIPKQCIKESNGHVAANKDIVKSSNKILTSEKREKSHKKVKFVEDDPIREVIEYCNRSRKGLGTSTSRNNNITSSIQIQNSGLNKATQECKLHSI